MSALRGRRPRTPAPLGKASHGGGPLSPGGRLSRTASSLPRCPRWAGWRPEVSGWGSPDRPWGGGVCGTGAEGVNCTEDTSQAGGESGAWRPLRTLRTGAPVLGTSDLDLQKMELPLCWGLATAPAPQTGDLSSCGGDRTARLRGGRPSGLFCVGLAGLLKRVGFTLPGRRRTQPPGVLAVTSAGRSGCSCPAGAPNPGNVPPALRGARGLSLC